MKYTLWFLNTHEWNSWKMLWRETLKTVKNVTSEEWSGIGGGQEGPSFHVFLNFLLSLDPYNTHIISNKFTKRKFCC